MNKSKKQMNKEQLITIILGTMYDGIVWGILIVIAVNGVLHIFGGT